MQGMTIEAVFMVAILFFIGQWAWMRYDRMRFEMRSARRWFDYRTELDEEFAASEKAKDCYCETPLFMAVLMQLEAEGKVKRSVKPITLRDGTIRQFTYTRIY